MDHGVTSKRRRPSVVGADGDSGFICRSSTSTFTAYMVSIYCPARHTFFINDAGFTTLADITMTDLVVGDIVRIEM